MSFTNLIRRHTAALRALLVLTTILGIGYPVFIWLVAQLPGLQSNADGSIIDVAGKPVGSSLIGQSFTDADGEPLPQYFQSRPSAAGYDPMATSASNLGPESVVDQPDKPSLLTQVCGRSRAVADLEGVSGARPVCTPGAVGAAVPPDAVTASGSGLDPDISPAYADLQVNRVAQARGLSPDRVRELVAQHTEGRPLGFLGEPRVNVLELNIALDTLAARG